MSYMEYVGEGERINPPVLLISFLRLLVVPHSRSYRRCISGSLQLVRPFKWEGGGLLYKCAMNTLIS